MGTKEKNMKNIREEFKEHGIFYTSTELANTLKEYVKFKPKTVYDPTCGAGNLLSVFDDDVEKYGQELYVDQLEIAKERLSNFHGYAGDTLKDDGFKDKQFDCITANPPFSIKWEQQDEERFNVAGVLPPKGYADYAFILHCLYHLKEDGIAVILDFPGILYRGNKEGKIRQWLIENNYIERVVAIPENQFVDTTISTCIIVLRKNKETTDIIFEDKKLNKEKTVTVEEVKDNGYNLSVSTYLFEEEKKEEINIEALNKQIDDCVIQRLITNLKANYVQNFMETFDKDEAKEKNIEFIERIKKAIDEYERGL